MIQKPSDFGSLVTQEAQNRFCTREAGAGFAPPGSPRNITLFESLNPKCQITFERSLAC
jgi:hypothetical protein